MLHKILALIKPVQSKPADHRAFRYRQAHVEEPVKSSPLPGEKLKISGLMNRYQTLPSASSERRSVGHWYTLSAAAAREERFNKIENSYDRDFRRLMMFELDTIISENRIQSALSGYMERNQKAVEHSKNEPFTQTCDSNQRQNLLVKMARDGDASIRVSVASNRQAPESAMWLLCKDSSVDVRLALISNDNLPVTVVKAMLHDPDERVRRKALTRLTLCEKPPEIVSVMAS